MFDNSQTEQHNNTFGESEPAQNRQPAPGRNPRLVIGGLDYFEMLMEQEEQA